MVRGATLALSIITNRIWTPVLAVTCMPLQDSIFDGDEEHFVWLGVGAWLGWTIAFFTVKWWLSRKSVRPPWSISQQTDNERV